MAWFYMFYIKVPDSTTHSRDIGTCGEYYDDLFHNGTMGSSTTLNRYQFVMYPIQFSQAQQEGTYTTSALRQIRSTYEKGLYTTRGIHEAVIQESLEIIETEITEIQKVKTDAIEKAKNLLFEYLDDENKQRYSKKDPLIIPSKLFRDIIYHIPISYGKIKALKENKVITELCLSVKDTDLPLEDVILAKLLHIRNDEENVLRVANHSNVQENLLKALN